MDFLTQQFIAFVRRFRIEIGRLQGALQKQTETIEQAAQTRNQQQQPPPQIRAELHILEAIENARTEQHNQTYRLQIAAVMISSITAIATIAAFAPAAYYAHWARPTYKEIATQTPKIIESADAATEVAENAQVQLDLTKKQMSAMISFGSFDPSRDNSRVSITIGNSGHVVSDTVQIHIEITHTTLDGLKQLSKPKSYSVILHDIVPTPLAWRHEYPLDPPPARDFRSQGDETSTIRASVKFDNGFGDTVERSVCVYYLGSHLSKLSF